MPCWGDFNEVLFEEEKRGENACDFGSIQEFRSVVDELGLKGIMTSGYAFTWSNRREGANFIEEKLDRVLATENWMNEFPASIRYATVSIDPEHPSNI